MASTEEVFLHDCKVKNRLHDVFMLIALLQVYVEWPTWHLSVPLFLFPPFLVHHIWLLLHAASVSPDSVDWPAAYCTLHGGTPAVHTIQSSHSTSSLKQVFSLIFLLKTFFPTSFSPHIWSSSVRACHPSGLLTAVFNLFFPYTIVFSFLHCATVCCMLKLEMASSSEILVPLRKTWQRHIRKFCVVWNISSCEWLSWVHQPVWCFEWVAACEGAEGCTGPASSNIVQTCEPCRGSCSCAS